MSVDDLLVNRTRISERIDELKKRNPKSEAVKSLEHAIKLVDRLIKMTHARESAQADAEAAVYAFEKARYTGNKDAAQREYNFYLTKAAYVMAKAFLNEQVAEEILAKNPEYAEHIRKGTIPDFF